MPQTADRCKETTTTTGTGTVTLLGAVAQFQSFTAAFADGSVVEYAIVGQTGTEWETGLGTFTAGGTTLSRDLVRQSSNSNALVNFSAGTKDAFATLSAKGQTKTSTGSNLAQSQGWALP